MQDHDLLNELAAFEGEQNTSLLAIRRPAGGDLLVEFEPKPDIKVKSLAAYWLTCLWRFLDDTQGNADAFEGLAFQALAERLSATEFAAAYGLLRARLTLPPPDFVELRQAYRTLNGRIISFAGVTTDGDYWCSFFQADVYHHQPLDEAQPF